MTISLQFFGAARQVTGSKHLLTVGDRRILLECGMTQGEGDDVDRQNRELDFDARDIDAVVLSHAHIDHSGSLPLLVKEGFTGAIHCTDGTDDLVEVLLRDSAMLQEQDAEYLKKKGIDLPAPYSMQHVEKTVGLLRAHRYHEAFEVLPGVRVEFFDAGHIFGSAMVFVTVEHEGRTVRIAFTGDHGRKFTPILRDPERLPECDVLICESTYGDREHDGTPDIEDQLAEIVNEEMRDGGRILIPAFAVGRTQNILWALGNLVAAGKIPQQPIFIDSPMARRATKITRGHPQVFDRETKSIIDSGRDPLFFDGVRFVADREESMELNDLRSGIIIAASGMCQGGRIVHHLKRTLPRREDCVLMVGYQARGTLGRRIQDGADHVRIWGRSFDVRCKVRSMHGLSAHADWKELLGNLRHLRDGAQRVFLVHGEEDAALTFADRLRDAGFRGVEVPERTERFEL